ncbi:MAG: hypothetical protein ABTQ29_05460 [Siculibacillus sp.]
MQDIIDKIAAQVGIEPELASKATSMIVQFIVSQAPAEYVDTIKQYVPGLDDVVAQGEAFNTAATEETSGGGLMGALGGLMGGGGLMGALGGLMGGQEGGMGQVMAMLGNLSKDGLELGQVQQVATGLVGQLREAVGDETVDKLVAQIPGASHFLA